MTGRRSQSLKLLHLKYPAGFGVPRPRPVAKEGGSRDPKAIQGIVNTLFWLHCGFNFLESKIIVIHKAVYIYTVFRKKHPLTFSFISPCIIRNFQRYSELLFQNIISFCFSSNVKRFIMIKMLGTFFMRHPVYACLHCSHSRERLKLKYLQEKLLYLKDHFTFCCKIYRAALTC